MKTKRVMTHQEREALNASIESEESYREQVRNAGRGEPGRLETIDPREDPKRLDAKIKHLKRVRDEGTPDEASGKDRAKIEAEYRSLKERLPDKLLTRKEMDLLPKHGYDYRLAVEKAKSHEVGNLETQREIQRFRELGTRLDPGNPIASSIEALRRNA